MPDPEKKALIRFVEQLPNEVNCAGYDDAVSKMAARYNATPQDLQMVLEQYHEFFRESTTQLLSAHYQSHHDVDFDAFTNYLEQAVKSVLLRMWCYGNEHSTRFALPQMLDTFHQEIESLTNPPKEN
jgi:hypothetical protein